MTIQTATRDEAAKMADALGNPGDVAEDLVRARADAQVFSSDHPRLIEDHPQEWVAVYDGRVVAKPTLEGLLDALVASDIPREHAVIRFIDQDEKVFIL